MLLARLTLTLLALTLLSLTLLSLTLLAVSLLTVSLLTVSLLMLAPLMLALLRLAARMLALRRLALLIVALLILDLMLLAGGVAVAVVRPTGLLAIRLALLAALLAFAFTVAPTLVVAMAEAAHGLDHAVIVISILPVGLGRDAIAGGCRLAGERLVLVEHLMRIAAHAHIGPAAVEKLVAIGWTVGVVRVVLLVLTAATAAAATATTVAAAPRPLPIIWSHYLGQLYAGRVCLL